MQSFALPSIIHNLQNYKIAQNQRQTHGSESKESTCNAGDTGNSGSTPGSRRSPGGGNGNPLQYTCLKNPMDSGAWWATVQRVVWQHYNVFYNFFLHLYMFDYLTVIFFFFNLFIYLFIYLFLDIGFFFFFFLICSEFCHTLK